MNLSIQNLSHTYCGPSGPVKVLNELSLSLESGRFIAVQGPSGCGKTTLLLAAGGLLRPTSGEILIAGENPYALSSGARAKFRAAQVGFVFQQFHLIPYLNVLENVLAPSLALPGKSAHSRARELIEQFGLAHRIRHIPSELSTGERQRVALARALLNRPKLLLADEPTGNLDSDNASIVLDHLAAFSSGGGSVLLVTHDPLIAGRAHQIIKMQPGKPVLNP